MYKGRAGRVATFGAATQTRLVWRLSPKAPDLTKLYIIFTLNRVINYIY